MKQKIYRCMKTTEEITKRILNLCDQKGITPNKLGTISGIEPSTITSIFYGKSKNPGIITIKYYKETTPM